MSNLAAASLVVGILLLVGGPSLYWVFFKMDAGPSEEPISDEPRRPLTENDVQGIESSLGVALPASYRSFLLSPAIQAVDGTSILADSSAITDATMSYRKGFEGISPWPQHLVYIGDEADASPYILDTASGAIARHPKGELSSSPFEEYGSFDELIRSRA